MPKKSLASDLDVEAIEISARYRCDHDSKYLTALAPILLEIGEINVKLLCRRYALSFTPEEIYDKASTAMMLMLSIIEANPDKIIQSFRSYMYFQCQKALFESKYQDFHKPNDLDTDIMEYKKPPHRSDPNECVDIILEHPKGKRAILVLYAYTHYRRAVKRLATFMPMPWIMAHAVEISNVHKYTHPKRGK